MVGQLFAGIGLGLVVGVLVGLSSSPVVSVVVGALATGMIALLGFARAGKDGQPAYGEGSTARLGAFGVACAVAVLLGLFMRTHNWLSPSIAEQVAAVEKAGYTAQEAREWVAYKNIGAPFTNAETTTRVQNAGKETASLLFAGENSGDCQYFNPSRYKDLHEQLYALEQQGGKYAEYAKKISTLDAGNQQTVLTSLKLLFCPQ